MPIYAFKCTECGEIFEQLRGMNDSDDDVRCPACGADKPRRQMSLFSSRSSGSTSSTPSYRPT